jgi:small subunit ribosomal protein S17
MAEECNDKKCYRHGKPKVKVRGERLIGRVVSAKGKNTAVVERAITKKLTKYQRWAKEKSRISAHNPPCIGAHVGDMVSIAETRKLSKTKAWTIIDIIQEAPE